MKTNYIIPLNRRSWPIEVFAWEDKFGAMLISSASYIYKHVKNLKFHAFLKFLYKLTVEERSALKLGLLAAFAITVHFFHGSVVKLIYRLSEAYYMMTVRWKLCMSCGLWTSLSFVHFTSPMPLFLRNLELKCIIAEVPLFGDPNHSHGIYCGVCLCAPHFVVNENGLQGRMIFSSMLIFSAVFFSWSRSFFFRKSIFHYTPWHDGKCSLL